MSTTRFFTVQNSYGAVLFYQTRFGDLTGCTVFFDVVPRGGGAALVDDQPGAIADGTYTIDGVSTTYMPADGVVYYQFKAPELAQAVVADARFRIVKDGKEYAEPDDDVIEIIIGKDLA